MGMAGEGAVLNERRKECRVLKIDAQMIDWVLARDLKIFNESLEIPVYFATRMVW